MKRSSEQYNEYRKVVRVLKANIHTKHPISVRRVKLGETLHGDCCLYENKFFIRINSNLNQSMAIEILLHEIAHAMAWNEKKDDHWYGWGIAFSKAYRVYLREYIEKSWKDYEKL